MNRLLATIAMLLLALGMFSGVATAQGNGCVIVYGGEVCTTPEEDEELERADDEEDVDGDNDERPEVVAGQVQQTTPCSTIIVTGDNWGDDDDDDNNGASVYIDREFGDDECPAEGSPENVATDTEAGAVTVQTPQRTADGRERVEVAEDGTFVARIQVPADSVGAYEVTVQGNDLTGQAKHQTHSYRVSEAASFVPLPESSTSSSTAVVAAALLGAVILGLAFNWSPAKRLFNK